MGVCCCAALASRPCIVPCPPLPQRRYTIRAPGDVPAVPPVAAGALQLLPPEAYAHQPATSFAIKFAGQAPSKVRRLGSWASVRCCVGAVLVLFGGLHGAQQCARSCVPACRHPALPPVPPQTRSSINVAVWTPDGRRLLTGTQVRRARRRRAVVGPAGLGQQSVRLTQPAVPLLCLLCARRASSPCGPVPTSRWVPPRRGGCWRAGGGAAAGAAPLPPVAVLVTPSLGPRPVLSSPPPRPV